MRILLLSHYYWPEVGAPQRRWGSLVQHLIRNGHRIIVAAPHPHYPHTCRDEFYSSKVGSPRTRVDTKLGGTWEFGEHGERIIRVPYLHSGVSMSRQLLDQGVAATGAANAVLSRLRGIHAPDVVISTTPALPFLLAGDAVSRILRIPHIAEVRDVWPDLIQDLSLVTNAAGKLLPKRITNYLEDSALPNLLTRLQRRATAVVVTTESFRTLLQRRGINAEVVRSGVGQSEIAQSAHCKGVSRGQINVLYVGTVGRSQDLSSAVIAASRVPGINLRIIGNGAGRSDLESLASAVGAPVEFSEQTTGAELSEHWRWADAGLVSLGAVPSHALTVPSKLYSLMVRGIPVLGIVAGEAADIITDNRAGIVATPGDIDSIVTAMQAMVQAIETPASRARQWVIDNASIDVMSANYERILKQVCV